MVARKKLIMKAKRNHNYIFCMSNPQFRHKLLIDYFSKKEPLTRSVMFIRDLNKYTKNKINTSVRLNGHQTMTILQYVLHNTHKIDYWMEFFMYLVDNGIDINGVDGNNYSVLEYATHNSDICHYIITHPSFTNDIKVLTRTMSVMNLKSVSSLEIYALMYRKGGIPNYIELFERNDKKMVIDLLVDYMKININTIKPSIIPVIVDEFIDDIDSANNTISHLFAKCPDIDINIVDEHGQTVVFNIVMRTMHNSFNHNKIPKILALINFISEKGVNVNLQNKDGYTVLDYILMAKLVNYRLIQTSYEVLVANGFKHSGTVEDTSVRLKNSYEKHEMHKILESICYKIIS